MFVVNAVELNAFEPKISLDSFLFCTPLSRTTNSSEPVTQLSVISVSSAKSTFTVVFVPVPEISIKFPACTAGPGPEG